MPISQLLRHPTLVDKLVDHVYEGIIRGDLKPGQRLTEEHLAADFGVSRTPVREAVRRLAEMGVVVVKPRSWLEVASADPREIHEVSQIRQELECLAVRLAGPRLTDEYRRMLEGLCTRCIRLSRSAGRVAVFRADSDFHLAIAELSGNRSLCDMLRRLDVKVQLCRAFACIARAKIQASVQYHREILEALLAADVRLAQERMRNHIRATLADQGETE